MSVLALAATACVQAPPSADRADSAGHGFVTRAAVNAGAARATVYVRMLGHAQLYALMDPDGDHRVDAVHPVVGARAPDVPAIVVAGWPRYGAPHGWRYVRYGEQRWLYLPFELESSSSLHVAWGDRWLSAPAAPGSSG